MRDKSKSELAQDLDDRLQSQNVPFGTSDDLLFSREELSKGVETMKFEVQENYLTIYLPKDLDHHSAEEIKREADRLIERGHIRYVIFDFAGTEFCDSSGIGVIMGRYKKVCMFGGEVWAAHTSERIKKILKMSGAAKIMQIYEEEK